MLKVTHCRNWKGIIAPLFGTAPRKIYLRWGVPVRLNGGAASYWLFSGHEPVPIPPGPATAAYRREISPRQFDRFILGEPGGIFGIMQQTHLGSSTRASAAPC